jgi:putative transport protein
LIVALVLARIGHFGPLVWYMPINANLAFRELGITLFLASVGLTAGEHFFRGVFSPSGAVWLLAAVVLSVLPALLVAALARKFLRLGFDEIGGLLAGATTDPPALAFACALGGSDSPSVAYATVYPAAMLLRILSAQVLAILMLAAA